jgi:VanZ family protein
MSRLFWHPAPWAAALLMWAVALAVASSLPGGGHELPVLHLDKVLHFVFFFCGGFLLAGALVCRAGPRVRWHRIVGVVTLTMALAGALDEWNQLRVPGRSGGDVADWLADVAGGLAGSLVLRVLWRRFSTARPETPAVER